MFLNILRNCQHSPGLLPTPKILGMKDAQLPALLGLEQPCSLQKIHVSSCSYEQPVNNTWGIVLCGSIWWWLGCFATLGHSHSTMGFLRNNLKIRSPPIKPPTDWGWNKAIASQFSVGHINLDAQNSSNSWSNHVKFTLFIVYPLCDVHNLDHIASCSRGVSVQRTAGRDFWQRLDVGVVVESPIAVEENAYATMQHQRLLQLRAPSTTLEKTEVN